MDCFAIADVRRCYGEEAVPDFCKYTCHLSYGERLIDVNDDKPKFLNFPLGLGGSGKMCQPDGTPIEE
jgi:hypothetical protein